MKTQPKFSKRIQALPAVAATASACWHSPPTQEGGARYVTMSITAPDLGELAIRMSTAEAETLAAELTRAAARARGFDRDEALRDHALKKVIR